MNRRSAVVAAFFAAAVVASGGAPANADSHEATVSVLHAVPDLTVDVYVDGEEFIPGFEPGTLTDPQSLPAGTYDIAIFAEGEGPDGDPAIEANGVEVPGGANATIVAHLSEEGDPTATAFVNDTSELAAGEARVTARHTAAAPSVDVRVDETPTFEGLTNPNEATADVEAGTISADIVLAGTEDVAIGPADLDLAEGTHTIAYAWGSAEDENLDIAVQTIDGLHGDPHGVPGGEAGLAATSGSGVWLATTAAGAGLAALVLAGFLRSRTRVGSRL